jgi:hypothetical protein
VPDRKLHLFSIRFGKLQDPKCWIENSPFFRSVLENFRAFKIRTKYQRKSNENSNICNSTSNEVFLPFWGGKIPFWGTYVPFFFPFFSVFETRFAFGKTRERRAGVVGTVRSLLLRVVPLSVGTVRSLRCTDKSKLSGTTGTETWMPAPKRASNAMRLSGPQTALLKLIAVGLVRTQDDLLVVAHRTLRSLESKRVVDVSLRSKRVRLTAFGRALSESL